jgi:PAS domain S-box-containing protein
VAFILILLLIRSSGYSMPLPQVQSQNSYPEIDSLIRLGYAVSDSNAVLGMVYAEKAIAQSEKYNYKDGQIKAAILYGGLAYSKGKYFKSVNSYLNAAGFSKATNDIKSLSAAYERIGYILVIIKQYDQADFYLQLALKYAVLERDTATQILLFYSFGLVAQDSKDIARATRNFLYGYFLSQKSQNPHLAVRGLKLMGSLCIARNELEQAAFYYKYALDFANSKDLVFEVGTIYSHLAHTSKLQKHFHEALLFDLQAARIRAVAKQKEHYISSLLNICDDYLILGKLDSARYFLTQGLRLLPEHYYYLQVYAYGLSKDLSLKSKDYKEALSAFEKYSVASDSLNAELNKQEIAIIQSKEKVFEIEQKNKLLEYQNTVQTLEIKNKNRATALYLLVIGVAFVLIAVFTWLYIRTKRSRVALEALNMQLDREVAERKQAEVDLRVSEASYRFLADNTPDLIIHLDSRARLVYVSPNCKNFLGYPIEEFRDKFTPLMMIHTEYHEAMRGLYQDMVNAGEPTIFTYEALRKDGSKFWVESLSNPLFDPETGKFSGTIAVIRNIEERVKYEEKLAENARQKEILLREIHHRVKNNFAILASVMTLQKVSAENKELTNLVNDLQTRIRSMSLVHELLYKNENLDVIPFDIYLMQLAHIVASGNRNKPVQLVYDLDPCILDIEIVLPLGLVVTELLTNAFKYAFDGSGENTLYMRMKVHETDASNAPLKWILTIRDNGKGLPEGFSLDSVTTLGSQIVRMLVRQVEGTVEARNADGACFDIIFKQYIERSIRQSDQK